MTAREGSTTGRRLVVLCDGSYSDFTIDAVLSVPADVDLAEAWETWKKEFPASAEDLETANRRGSEYSYGRPPRGMETTEERLRYWADCERRRRAFSSWRDWIATLPGVFKFGHELFNRSFPERDYSDQE